METRISVKGQITLPVSIRRKLGIRPGDVLEVRSNGNNVVLKIKEKNAGQDTSVGQDILKATAGLWKDRNETGEGFIRQLRDSDRLKGDVR